MNIGIIGAGHIGSTLATNLVALGHSVEIANSRGPETLRGVADETGAAAVTAEAALQRKDVIVLTIPMKRIPELPSGLFRDVPDAVPVIDTCNYYPRERDGRIDAIEDGLTESEWVAQQIGHPTIKAFNNIHARELAQKGMPKGSSGRLSLPVSGDDPDAKAKVMGLVDELGFDPVDNGVLSESFRQQPGQPVYGNNAAAGRTREQLSEASAERSSKFSG